MYIAFVRKMKTELATRIVTGLREAGIDFMGYLPESRLSQNLPVMRNDSRFELAPAASKSDQQWGKSQFKRGGYGDLG